MALATNPSENIRFNGNGRVYITDVGGTLPGLEVGEFETLGFNLTVSSDTLPTRRTADRSTIIDRESAREGVLNFNFEELSKENLQMALLGGSLNTSNQAAGYKHQMAVSTVASDVFVDLGYLDVFITKIEHGTISGPGDNAFAVGGAVTFVGSGASGNVGWAATGYVEIYNLSGTPVAGDVLTETSDSDVATVTGVSTLEDIVVTDATNTVRHNLGTGYDLDVDYGYFRKLSGGCIDTVPEVSFDYPAVNVDYFEGMQAGSVTKQFVFVSDGAEEGPRMRWTFKQVKIVLSGDLSLIGDGLTTGPVAATVLKDTTAATGQEYFKVELLSTPVEATCCCGCAGAV